MTKTFQQNKSFFKGLATLGVPIALQNLLSVSCGLINMIMVGRLGDVAISGVYMGNQIKTLLTVFLYGVEGAIIALSAQYHGKGDTERIRRVCGIGLIFVGAVSVLLTLVCFFFPKFTVSLFTDNLEIVDTGAVYLRILSLSFIFFSLSQVALASLRSVESTKIGFFSSALSLTTNILLGYPLIFGKLGFARLEITGAAIATVVAHAVEFIFISIYVLFMDKRLNIRIKKFISIFKIEKELISEFIKYGSPVISAQLLWGGNMLFASAVMGRQGGAAVAAMSVAGSLLNISHIVTNGCAGALGVLIGKAIGAGEFEKARRNARSAQILFIILGLFTSGFILLIKMPFISIYKMSPEAISEAKKFINVLAAVTIGTCYQSAVLNGILKSAKDTRFVFGVELFSVLALILPLALTAARLSLAPSIIFAALKSDQFIKCIPAAVRVNRFKWLKRKKIPSNGGSRFRA